MITNTGKTIVSKYLTGQAPAYASYIAIGTGAAPLKTLSHFVDQKALASGVVTLRTTDTHTFSVGDYITVAGLGTSFDGVYVTTTGTTGTTVKYTSSDTVTTTSGTITTAQLGSVSKNYSTKTALDFEVARFPIITPRGYVIENNISKIVFSGEIPTETRYEVTEIGIFSAESNPSTITNSSRNLYTFESTEDWKYWNGTSDTSAPRPPLTFDSAGTIVITYDPVFVTNSDNSSFSNYPLRLNRQERPRFGSNTYIACGNSVTLPSVTNIVGSGTAATITTGSVHGILQGDVVSISNTTLSSGAFNGTYIVLSVPTTTSFTVANTTVLSSTASVVGTVFAVSTSKKSIRLTSHLDLSDNSSTDQIKIAFSLVSRDNTLDTNPTTVNVAIHFLDSSGQLGATGIATIPGTSFVFPNNGSLTNRYYVANIPLSSFIKKGSFSWGAIESIEISSSVSSTTAALDTYYIAYDAVRLENVSTTNALYGLTGYSPVVNSELVSSTYYARPIVKETNVPNTAEFRMVMDVT